MLRVKTDTNLEDALKNLEKKKLKFQEREGRIMRCVFVRVFVCVCVRVCVCVLLRALNCIHTCA